MNLIHFNLKSLYYIYEYNPYIINSNLILIYYLWFLNSIYLNTLLNSGYFIPSTSDNTPIIISWFFPSWSPLTRIITICWASLFRIGKNLPLRRIPFSITRDSSLTVICDLYSPKHYYIYIIVLFYIFSLHSLNYSYSCLS